jgi:hypothetical protein
MPRMVWIKRNKGMPSWQHTSPGQQTVSSSIHTQVTAVMAAGGDVAAAGRGAPIRGH